MISILVPVQNEPNLGEWLTRLSSQTQHHEVIVIDTSPQPSTFNVQTVQYLHQPEIKTRAEALNQGAKHAKGELLLFLHADCDLPKDALFPIHNTSVEAGAFLKTYQPNTFFLQIQSAILNFVGLHFHQMVTGTNGIFVKNNLFLEWGGFAEVPLCEDLLLWKKIRKTCKVRIVPLKIQVSSRKYETALGAKRIIQNGFIYFLFTIGVSPRVLKKLY